METWITELTPLSFLERSAEVHPDSVAVVYGPDRWTYRDLAERSRNDSGVSSVIQVSMRPSL